MGLLRKLAGLVVEFPEDTKKGAPAAAEDEHDVVAAIEKVRADLAADLKPKFEAPGAEAAPVKPPGTATAGKPPAALPPSPDDIPLLKVLSINDIYKTASLETKPDGFDVFKVEALLNDPEMADLQLDIRARMVRMTLKSMGHELQDVLADAARRDSALDQYLEFLQQTVDSVAQRATEANAKHKLELEEFTAAKQRAIEANLARVGAAHQALEDFQRSKTIEEERLFSTVSPFVAAGQNPVKVETEPQPAKGQSVNPKEDKS
jgi:hypothetical protein